MVALVQILLVMTTLAAPRAQEVATVYLVRHAEASHAEGSGGLSPRGHQRAAVLAELMAARSVTVIHVESDSPSRATARAVSATLGVAATAFPPGDTDLLAAEIRRSGGDHLVVARGEVVLALLRRLGGLDPVGTAFAPGEHDRLYTALVAPGRPTQVTMSRY